jgi:hypothetical protein
MTATHDVCPHCRHHVEPVLMATHLRDTGAMTVRPAGACPVLFDQRNTQGTTARGFRVDNR